MGLGPPVCIDCVRFFDHINSQEDREQLKKLYPDIGYWWCSKCGKTETNDSAFSVGKELRDKMIANRSTLYTESEKRNTDEG